jgi:hypothetical protein
MASEANDGSAQDWRLQAELDIERPGGALGDLVARFRGPDITKDIEAGVPSDVVVTHDGRLLFAYAPSEATITSARRAIEGALEQDGIRASIRISHWDEDYDRWRQVDPPESPEEQRVEQAAAREDSAIETRTMVASTGRLVRAEFEQTMLAAASRLDLECKLAEHSHLLTTQVAFTVTGQKRKIDQFAQELRAEGRAMLRTDEWLVASPL